MTAINYYYSLIILYIMETNKRYELLRLNTLEQSDLVLYDLLREPETGRSENIYGSFPEENAEKTGS